MARYKINLGLSESEESLLTDFDYEKRTELIAKAKGFGLFLRVCVYCAFQE